MDDLTWGLMMMVVGMGVVFALLLALMAVLMLIGRLDRPPVEPTAAAPAPAPAASGPDDTTDARPAAPTVRIVADGLDENQVAAITVAVMTHAENRRRLAAPETRAHAPGSQLFASRWLAVGRGFQNNPFTRR
ncbi:MAG: OadG family protein [Nigerium sp.]|nr:OadG family protein [Nigerium sp.]